MLHDAQLKPNRPDRDRVGWDCVVTWPFDGALPADSRPSPLACHIQLKTVWAGNDSISLNLGTLEYIVKDSRPAFIVIFEVDDKTLSFVSARVIHVAGDFLAEILKRMRQAQADGSSASVVYSPSPSRWGSALTSFDGATLRAALEAAISGGMAAYEKAKRRELAELGYERGALRLNATFQAGSHEELVDGFLGLRVLSVSLSSGTETRFGIPLEIPDLPWPQRGAVRIRTKRIDRCKIIVSRGRDGEALRFEGELFSVPERIAGRGRVILEARTALARIRLDLGDGAGSVIFGSVDGIETIEAKASDWADYFRLAAWSIASPVTLELRPGRLEAPPPIIGGTDPVPNIEEAAIYERMADAADAADWVMGAAKAPGTKFTWHQLLDAAPQFVTMRTMKLSPQDLAPLTFTLDPAAGSVPTNGFDMLYISRVPIGEKEIAFAARVHVRRVSAGDGYELWVGDGMQLEFVQKIGSGPAHLEKFVREAQRYTGIAACLGPSPGNLSAAAEAP